MKRILHGIIIFFAFTIIAINLLSIFKIPLFGFRIFKIGSGSMEPNLKINDIIVIKNKKTYEIGDIVVFRGKDSETITHRIVKKNGSEIITKGDSNNTCDEPISINDIIGKVLFKITGLGFVLYLFNTPLFWIILFIIGIVITIWIPDKR